MSNEKFTAEKQKILEGVDPNYAEHVLSLDEKGQEQAFNRERIRIQNENMALQNAINEIRKKQKAEEFGPGFWEGLLGDAAIAGGVAIAAKALGISAGPIGWITLGASFLIDWAASYWTNADDFIDDCQELIDKNHEKIRSIDDLLGKIKGDKGRSREVKSSDLPANVKPKVKPDYKFDIEPPTVNVEPIPPTPAPKESSIIPEEPKQKTPPISPQANLNIDKKQEDSKQNETNTEVDKLIAQIEEAETAEPDAELKRDSFTISQDKARAEEELIQAYYTTKYPSEESKEKALQEDVELKAYIEARKNAILDENGIPLVDTPEIKTARETLVKKIKQQRSEEKSSGVAPVSETSTEVSESPTTVASTSESKDILSKATSPFESMIPTAKLSNQTPPLPPQLDSKKSEQKSPTSSGQPASPSDSSEKGQLSGTVEPKKSDSTKRDDSDIFYPRSTITLDDLIKETKGFKEQYIEPKKTQNSTFTDNAMKKEQSTSSVQARIEQGNVEIKSTGDVDYDPSEIRSFIQQLAKMKDSEIEDMMEEKYKNEQDPEAKNILIEMGTRELKEKKKIAQEYEKTTDVATKKDIEKMFAMMIEANKIEVEAQKQKQTEQTTEQPEPKKPEQISKEPSTETFSSDKKSNEELTTVRDRVMDDRMLSRESSSNAPVVIPVPLPSYGKGSPDTSQSQYNVVPLIVVNDEEVIRMNSFEASKLRAV